jgi:hypothetical protein
MTLDEYGIGRGMIAQPRPVTVTWIPGTNFNFVYRARMKL